jgi:hypothetical protein
VVINPDGSFSADAGGLNLLWTTQENSFPGVPTISYTTGHAHQLLPPPQPPPQHARPLIRRPHGV